MVDGFVDGNKAYIILNNLEEEDKDINLNLFENSGIEIERLFVKHFHLDDKYPVYDNNVGVIDSTYYSSDEIPNLFHLNYYGTMVLEYTFADKVPVTKTSEERKYYATDYFKSISGNNPISFQINNVDVPEFGEAVLRLGMAREHGKTLRPNLLINGHEVIVPANFKGDDQKDRDVFFGVIEIDVPTSFLQTDNTINVIFPESGGHISSVALQVFSFSELIGRSEQGAVAGISVSPDTLWLPLEGWFQLQEEVHPYLAKNKKVIWKSSDEQIATVSQTGMVHAQNLAGEVTIYATTEEGNFTDSCLISISEALPGTLAVDDINKYKTTTYYTGGTIDVFLEYFAGTNQTVAKTNGGVSVLLRHLDKDWKVIEDWLFCDSTTIGTNRGTAKVTIQLDGITPSNELPEGHFYFLFPQFWASNGEKYTLNGLSHINIEKAPVNISSIHNDSKLKVFPNPSRNKLMIEVDKHFNDEVFIALFNMNGVKLISKKITEPITSVDVSNLSCGNYIIRISDNSYEPVMFQKY